MEYQLLIEVFFVCEENFCYFDAYFKVLILKGEKTIREAYDEYNFLYVCSHADREKQFQTYYLLNKHKRLFDNNNMDIITSQDGWLAIVSFF